MRPKTLWFSLLPALDAILNSRSLTEAADRAFLTQPALSIALKKARLHFNDDLVIFKNTGPELTELGEALKPRVQIAIQAASEALNLELDFDPYTSRRTVKIMCNTYLENAFLPYFLERVYSASPGINVEIIPFSPLPDDPYKLEDVDIILAAKTSNMENYQYTPLFEDRLACLIWRGNKKIGESIQMKEWLQLRHATAVKHNNLLLSPEIIQNLHQQSMPALRTHSAMSMPNMIIGTDLVITSIASYCKLFLNNNQLRLVEIEHDASYKDDFNLKVGVIWKSYRKDEPFIQWLAKICEQAGKDFQEKSSL